MNTATKTISTHPKPLARIGLVRATARTETTCPIPGCNFHYATPGARGWVRHVGNVDMHPNWHPEVKDLYERVRLYKAEFMPEEVAMKNDVLSPATTKEDSGLSDVPRRLAKERLALDANMSEIRRILSEVADIQLRIAKMLEERHRS
jgi:hypothetical protein